MKKSESDAFKKTMILSSKKKYRKTIIYTEKQEIRKSKIKLILKSILIFAPN